MSGDWICVRCGKGFDWEQMTSTPAGNLFCPTCWPTLDGKHEPKRNCPVDGSEMQKRLIEDLILIDICSACGGTWFDKTEIEVIKKLSSDSGWNTGFMTGWLIG